MIERFVIISILLFSVYVFWMITTELSWKQNINLKLNMSEQENLTKYHVQNMYDFGKHINHHDIAGVKGITRQQMIEL